MQSEAFGTARGSNRTPDLQAWFRRATGFIPSGVAILMAPQVTMTVSSLHCASLNPPLISVALSRESRRAAAIIEHGGFRVRLLRSGEEQLARDEGTASGAGLVEMECEISAKYPVGDHDLILARVSEVKISGGYPMVYWRRGFHVVQPAYNFLSSEEKLEEFISAWKQGTLPKTCWTHAAHVAVAAYHAVRFPDVAFDCTKAGILAYNTAVGTENSDVSGYHETLTRFWSEVIGCFVAGIRDPWRGAVTAVQTFGEDRDLHRLYYSFDVVRSSEARRQWIPPDLRGPFTLSH